LHELVVKFLPPDIPEVAVKDLANLTESIRSLVWNVAKPLSEQSPRPDVSIFNAALRKAIQKKFGAALRPPLLSFLKHYKPSITLPLITSGTLEGDKPLKEDIALTIASLKLIDTRSVTIEQLIEVREDVEAMEKLRRLRIFAYQNYQGKPKDYIEDDILTRIADYEQAVKKWGFTTASGAITTLINSSLIAGGVAGSFLTAYYNAPLSAIASAMASTGLAIANMAVSVGQQRFARMELMANNPVSYISYAKEKLEEK
jgi:hypothetical protein